mgnify:FL=1
MAGNWKGSVPIPDQSRETREWSLNDEDHVLFFKVPTKNVALGA